jgi:hypothetical protein
MDPRHHGIDESLQKASGIDMITLTADSTLKDIGYVTLKVFIEIIIQRERPIYI